MRTAEEILNENLPFGQMIKAAVIHAINVARLEAIEETSKAVSHLAGNVWNQEAIKEATQKIIEQVK